MTSDPTGGEYLFKRIEAQRSATRIQLLALAGAAVCIALAARLQGPINTQRKELQLVMHSDLYKDLPPIYALASAAGGPIRGLLIIKLWMTSDKLKEEGKYYSAHQCAKWICTLQPRFPAVWSFQSWNMSYNISVATHTPRERWQWVYNGIRLLRDEGIPNNPRIVPLYHQLAWTFFHKVGDRTDDMHWFYKRNLAAAMETLLGPPPAGANNEKTIDWFRPVAEAPHTVAELVAKRPTVKILIDKLSDLGVDVEASTSTQRVFHPLEETLFTDLTRYRFNKQLASLRANVTPATPNMKNQQAQQQEKRREFFESTPAEDFEALLACLRAKVLREQYRMDPAYMLYLTGQMGTDQPIPIDWRTPWAHSLYWAKYGVDQAGTLKNIKEFDILNTDRITLFSLAALAKQGRYTFRLNPDEPDKSFLWAGPDTRYIEAMHRKYLDYGKKHADEGEQVGDTAGETLRSGHVNNLQAAIVALYLAGRHDEAHKYLEYLAINYKDPYTKETQPKYLGGLDDFVYGELTEVVGSYSEAVYAIHSLLVSAYINLANGSLDEYMAAMQNAAVLYERYQKEHKDSNQGRLLFLKFVELRASALFNFVTSTEYPMLIRSLTWNREPEEVRRICYDMVAPAVTEQCRILGLDVTKAFPEPTGMAEWRKEHPAPENPEDYDAELRKKDREAKEKP